MKGEDAMGKTANYGLPKWEKSDFIKMDDFNAAFGKIDETLKACLLYTSPSPRD